MNKQIFITFKFEGEHRYPDAPEQVSYLRNTHRHMFHVRVDIDVFDNERDIEFHMFRNELRDLYSKYQVCNNRSCETLCDELGKYIALRYPNRSFRIEISEDGENGAVLYS